MVKTTLGPKGMDKILQPAPQEGGGGNDRIQITNDGATILSKIFVDNPAAKILIEISKTQDDEVGDGTTTVAVLCGELLREADRLVQNHLHPQIIIEGFRAAHRIAKVKLEDISQDN